MADYNCKRCGETNPDNFYKSNGAKTKCKKCHTMETHYKQKMMKVKGVEYLGGKCLDCGTKGSPWIFDFHHRDPSEKEWHWGNRRTSNWDNLKKELDKCDLLCSNCHRLRHEQEWLETLVDHHPMFDKKGM